GRARWPRTTLRTARFRTGGRSSACTGAAASSNARPPSRGEPLGVNPLPGVVFRSNTALGRHFIIDYSLEVIGHLPRLGREISGANLGRARWTGGAQPAVEA